ncbi:MAG: cysteine--tRNA ligase, partial [Thiobacillaceae bacterium]|nr:cysteine--tRNA ligase [Thiobacillaceae bacterium]
MCIRDRTGKDPLALAAEFARIYLEDLATLGVEPADAYPRVSEHIPEIIALIEELFARGHAYQVDGDVYFSIPSFPAYGRLSGRSEEEMLAGARVEVDPRKRHPMDFALWKAAKPGEPAWDSPWGPGRPGWHIECSAMALKHLGPDFDMHGGSEDLIFPHHENEIAQSEGAHGCTFVNYWLHNGFVRVNEEKMSKSLGNFFTIREVLRLYDAEVVRLFILRAHYRSPLNYSDTQLDEARAALTRLYTALRGTEAAALTIDWASAWPARFKAAMDDDFNTPEALAVLFELASEVNRTRSAPLAAELKALGGVLGLLGREPEAFLQAGGTHADYPPERIEALIAERLEARRKRDYARADAIRAQLKAAGIVLEDGPQGTTWRRL